MGSADQEGRTCQSDKCDELGGKEQDMTTLNRRTP